MLLRSTAVRRTLPVQVVEDELDASLCMAEREHQSHPLRIVQANVQISASLDRLVPATSSEQKSEQRRKKNFLPTLPDVPEELVVCTSHSSSSFSSSGMHSSSSSCDIDSPGDDGGSAGGSKKFLRARRKSKPLQLFGMARSYVRLMEEFGNMCGLEVLGAPSPPSL
ncbi:hypothetical protein KP509_21G022400 [Ceratopteris richardii]|uniref:Uncharacterized protein n=1 Tax=Ceratopteris richardii TaxID=49495 RepID=A0A8T2S818_CERRI|nr:hypothetical protein KP509_21G022400 [Ceratopteris richardii]